MIDLTFPSRLLQPGLRTLPPGMERYRVRGGGAVVVKLEPGDQLNVVDPEGGQPCEIAAFDLSGAEATELLGQAASGPALGMAAILSGWRRRAIGNPARTQDQPRNRFGGGYKYPLAPEIQSLPLSPNIPRRG